MKANYLSVGHLLKVIKENNLPNDTKVCYHRIEDSYFDGQDISMLSGQKPGAKSNGWSTIKIKGDSYYYASKFNKHLENAQLVREGKFDPEDVAPYYMREDLTPIDLEDESILAQYIEGFCAFYNKEKNILCITAHY